MAPCFSYKQSSHVSVSLSSDLLEHLIKRALHQIELLRQSLDLHPHRPPSRGHLVIDLMQYSFTCARVWVGVESEGGRYCLGAVLVSLFSYRDDVYRG